MTATATGSYCTTALVKGRLGITGSTDDTEIGLICDQVNQFIESPQGCGRIIAPITSATYVIDGSGLSFLYFPKGIRAITALSIGDSTGDTKDTVNSSDILLRPLDQDRTPGWPAFYLYLSDVPVSTVTRTVFPAGRGNVSMTATTGWAAIPDDLIDVAITTAVRAWHARQAGQTDIVGTDELGSPIVSRFIAPAHWKTIQAYRVKKPAVIG